MKPLRAYVDTSVFGGCFDPEFETESRRFFGLVREGRVIMLISQVVLDELADAPAPIRDWLQSFSPESVIPVPLTTDIISLRDAYLESRIVSPRYVDDATHVAAATAARADALVSWNFKHIVRVDKMRAYNQVNLQSGFGILSIVTPQEVRFDDDEEEQESV